MDNLTLNERIWQVIAAIPSGRVATYGQVAKLAGCPNHARYVGTTLKHLPADSTLPWYRVINARGEISFAKESPAYQRQKALLEAEGVVFIGAKVRLSRYGFEQD